MRFWLVVLFVASLAVGLFESSLYVLIGWLVDLLARLDARPALAPSTARSSCWPAALILFVRPILHFAQRDRHQPDPRAADHQHDPLAHASLYARPRARAISRRDFAGRLANRITQGGPAIREIAVTILDTLLYVAIFAFTALGAVLARSARGSPLPMAAVDRRLRGAAALLRAARPGRARSGTPIRARSLVGRIVDSYTNILTVKLFARARGGALGGARRARRPTRSAFLNSFRLITGVDVVADGDEQRLSRRDRRRSSVRALDARAR